MKSSLSRRSFVQGAALGTAAVTAAVTASAWADAAPVDADSVEWDAEYDVVILGLGGAGANAAVAAYEEGATVLVCEKAPEGQEPCNTKASGQFVMATDDADALYTYLSQLMGKFTNWDEEALRGYCDGCAENFAWMTGPMGGDVDIIYSETSPAEQFPFEKMLEASWHLEDDPWGIGRPGYVYTWDEFPEIPESAHCKCLTATGTRFDAGYYNLCMAAVNARVDDERLTVWRGCPGRRLITDAEGAVVGAVVEKDGVELNIKANGGVCLCTGGLEASRDMMASYTQIPYCYLQAGTMNTGDGIKMAMKVGADLWHMSNVSGFNWAYQSPYLSTCSSVTGLAAKGIYAGISGKRFMNESAGTRHGRIDIGGRWISTPMPLPTYCILEAANAGDKLIASFSDGNVDELADGQIIAGETIEELSANIRAVGDAPDFNVNGELDTALVKYNAHCHANDGAGEEDDFGRMCTVPVENGPFYALKIGPTMYNTQGGPRRNQYAQVINTEGYPIQGLFEGGEMGSVFADMYNGSGNLGETMVFGRYAGKNAALRAKGEFVGATERALTHQEKAEVAAENAAATWDIAGVPDGTYEGSGQGYGGKITLAVTVAGGQITACEVLESSETATIGELALPVYCEDIVALQNPADIDVASGASNTLRGFTAAVEAAVTLG